MRVFTVGIEIIGLIRFISIFKSHIIDKISEAASLKISLSIFFYYIIIEA
jgi:hypothetical protein